MRNWTLRLTCTASALAILALTTIAHADDGPRRWYGSQTLAVDAVSVTTFVTGASVGGKAGSAMTVLGFAGYFVGPPVVHFAHGNFDRGALDPLVRLGLVAGGAILGLAMGEVGSPSCHGNEEEGGRCTESAARRDTTLFVIGQSVGVLGASAVDAWVFAYEGPASGPRVSFGVMPVRGGMGPRVGVSF